MLFDPSNFAGGLCQIARDVNGDGTIDMAIRMEVSPTTGARSYVFKIDEYEADGVTLIDTFYEPAHHTVKRYGPVVAGHVYKVSAASKAFNGVESAFSSTVTITPTGKTSYTPTTASVAMFITRNVLGMYVVWPTITDKDYDHTDVYISGTATYPPTLCIGTLGSAGGIVQPGDSDTSSDSLYWWIQHVDRSGNKSDFIGNTGYGSAGRLVAIRGVETRHIEDNMIREKFAAQTNTLQAVGTGGAIVETILTSHGTGCNTVDITLSFRNVSGATRTFDVSLEDASAVVYKTFSSVAIADNGMFSTTVTVANPSGSATTFKMRVTPTVAASINNTYLVAVTGRR